MEKTQSKHLVGSIICGLLTAFGIVTNVLSLISGSNGLWALADCVALVLWALILYYVFIGYKKPHGNLLKYIILIRVIITIICVQTIVPVADKLSVILGAIEIGLSCYIAGRLVKVKENFVFMIAVAFCLVVMLVSDIISGSANIGIVGSLVTWLDICVAYFLRYKEHKEAGLEDAPKK